MAARRLKKLFVFITPDMRTDEVILFVRRLSLFLRAGIPIISALELIQQGASRPAYVRVIKAISEEVLRGKRLSDALARFPRIFDPLHVSLVQVGETSGSLSNHLEQIALLCTRNRDDKRRMMSAALYPLIIVCATVALTAFLTLYAFPKILPLFKGFHQTLPLPTRILIGLTEFTSNYGWLVLVLIVLSSGAFVYALRFSRFRQLRDRILLSIPVFGSMILYYHAASIARTLSTLLESGVGILTALDMLAKSIQHSQYEEALTHLYTRISEGRPVAEGFSERVTLFPSVAVQLITAGELTGTLPESLRNVAQIYEQYLEERSRTLQALIEPVLMLIMGCIVGFVALAIITPIYGLTQGISAQ